MNEVVKAVLEEMGHPQLTILYGMERDLPVLALGELGYCVDAEILYIGGANGNVKLVDVNGGGTGDMRRAVYDTDKNGIVDNAEALGGKSPEFLIPTGGILPYAGKAAPKGYLFCDGTAVSRENNAGLFAVIGTTYGAGDGSTTFNLPNLSGRYAAGVTDTLPVGTQFGAANYKLQWANMPEGAQIPLYQTQFKAALAEPDAPNLYGVNNYLSGNGTAIPTLPPSLALNYIIKT